MGLCLLGSPGNTRRRAVVGHASFQRLSSGMRYAGSGTVRMLFSLLVTSSSRRRAALAEGLQWRSTVCRLSKQRSDAGALQVTHTQEAG
jgi:hypothetical protein